MSHLAEPTGQQLDVKHILSISLLGWCEEVEQERAEPGLVEHLGHEPVARAVAAASAPVGENNDPTGPI